MLPTILLCVSHTSNSGRSRGKLAPLQLGHLSANNIGYSHLFPGWHWSFHILMSPVAFFLLCWASACALGFFVPLFLYLQEGRDRSAREGKVVLGNGLLSDKGVKGERWLNILLQKGFAGARKIQLVQTGSAFLSPPSVSNASYLFLHPCHCREQLGLHFSSHLLSQASLCPWRSGKGQGKGKTARKNIFTPFPCWIRSQRRQNQMNRLSMGKSRTL